MGDKLKRLLYLGMHMDHTHLSYKDRLSNILSWFGLLIFLSGFIIVSVISTYYGFELNTGDLIEFASLICVTFTASVLVHTINYLINGRFKFLPWKPTK